MLGEKIELRGSYGSLVGAVKHMAQKKNLSTPEGVLRFNSVWLPIADSNHGQGD